MSKEPETKIAALLVAIGAKDAAIHGECCRRMAELEVQLEMQIAILQEQLDLQTPKEALKQLQQENAALLVAIEAKNDLLRRIEYVEPSHLVGHVIGAVALCPSTELLEARDRVWDAKLLRDVATTFHCRAMAGTKNEIPLTEFQLNGSLYAEFELDEFARKRKSGEWQPELGD